MKYKSFSFFILFLITFSGCSSSKSPYPSLSSVPEKPMLELLPEKQKKLKSELEDRLCKKEEMMHYEEP